MLYLTDPLGSKMSRMDHDVAAGIAQVPGVIVTHHYQGEGHFADYYIHCEVEDAVALHRLCQLSARANAPLHVYEHSETEFRYTLVVNDYSREILMCGGSN
jgi:hypothetical protein